MIYYISTGYYLIILPKHQPALMQQVNKSSLTLRLASFSHTSLSLIIPPPPKSVLPLLIPS